MADEPGNAGVTASAPATTNGAGAPAGRLSITGFLTDGSLAGLCAELSALVGAEVALLDAEGRRVVRVAGAERWRVAEAPAGAFERIVPVHAGGRAIGALALGAGAASEAVVRAVELLAATAGEFCAKELELRHSIAETQALAGLASMLSRATKVETVLDIALQSALDLLRMDAGSVVLFEQQEGVSAETEEDLVLKASRNLSRAWLENPLPASRGRIFDTLALRGELVESADLLADERVLIPEEVRREGLRGFINCGLLFQEKPIGVIRLYSRTPRAFAEAERRLLRSIAQQAAVAVEQARLLKLQEQDARLQRQLQLAADVQRRMLPRRVPQIPRLDVAAMYAPSFELGGDFYDLFELSGSLGIAVGDVVGKGIAAALLMSAVRSSLRAHVQDLYHIEEVIDRVNAAMCRDTLDSEFATLWYGVIEPSALRLTWCAAGHEPPFIVSGPDVIDLTGGGLPVGVDPAQRYSHVTHLLKSGDVLVAYTDGLTDTVDFGGRRFGRGRVREAVRSLLKAEPGAEAARVLEHLFRELRQFAGVLPRPDDQTVVVVKVR